MSNSWRAELERLMRSVLDDRARPSGLAELDRLLDENPDALNAYVSMMQIDSMLRWQPGRHTAPVSDPLPPIETYPRFPIASPPAAVNWLFSYGVAVVLVGIALIFAWAFQISHFHREFAADRPSHPPIERSDVMFVGRVTGMKDCRWSDPDTQTVVGASVLFNRQYALASGLLEITYSTGARVILEGPCTYKVDSSAGGFLKRGKLTARIRGQRSEVRGRKSENSPLFSVKTPTATITDLGTEFGVEVNDNGDTVSHVFQGSVRVESIGGVGSASVAPVKLNKGESVRVTKNAAEAVRFTHTTTMPKFVRAILHPRRNFIDLADIVAGGDGFGNARGRGIEFSVGKLVDSPPKKFTRHNTGRYLSVEESPLIDGVFIPDGGDGTVQIDSAGHRYDGFTDTCGRSWNYLWSGQLPVTETAWVSCWLGETNYAGRKHSVISMPPNKGVTFDLEAIRRTHPGVELVRFTAAAGNAELRSSEQFTARVSADLWVFVDGELLFARKDINAQDGEFRVDIPLQPNNRFLTLVATDAGNDLQFDWMLFGDPRLHLKNNSENTNIRVNRKEVDPIE